jgi:hypothetical protein
MAAVTKNRNFFNCPLLLLKQQWTIKISSPLFSILSLAAILVGSWDHRTQFWKGTTQESFRQSLSQNVPKFELYKHNDELFNMYYRIFYEL